MNFWTCHICGDIREDSHISVHTRDVSEEMNLPTGTVTENVRYCKDKIECVAQSKTKRLIKIDNGTI